MDLSKLRPAKGATKETKRRGRGPGSGHGKTSCRGNKGAGSRAGSSTHMAFEGGQMPLVRRLPKRGFTNENKVAYQVVNVEDLNSFKENAIVGVEEFFKSGKIREPNLPIKILGDGELKKPLTVKVNAVSNSAKGKIEKAGGKVEIV